MTAPAELAALRRSTRAALCLECGKCSALCPLAPLGGFSAARMVAIQDPEHELHGAAVSRCLACGACEVRCPQQVRFTDFVLGLRQLVPEAERPPCPHGELFAATARWEARASAPVRDLGWLGDELEIAPRGEVGLFVGCLPLFDAFFRQELGIETVGIARAAIATLNRLGVVPVVAVDERCCGHDLLWQGDGETFRLLAAANARVFTERGVKLLLTTCGECCRTWRRDYSEAVPGLRLRVQHLSEFLAEKAAAGAVAFSGDGQGAVTYQDPCRLGRQLGVVEAPRRLLDAVPGIRRLEMARAGVDALCCGTPGFTRCDGTARQLQSERLAEAAATGADTLLTACPKCLIHFACAQADDRRRGRPATAIGVQDLTVFLAQHLSSVPSEEVSDERPA